MDDNRKIADKLRSERLATGYGVFFVDRKIAEAFQRGHGGQVEEAKGGWFVRTEIKDASADDPIIRAINDAIDKAGLRSN